MKDFMLGCNFWDSKSGTDMWRNFDEKSLAYDLDTLAANGVRVMRCFPNWRDFQPVMAMRACRSAVREYRMADETMPTNEYYIDMTMIDRFRTFANLAKERGIGLVVSIMTGWMSGRMFYPPVLEGKDLISDPESLVWEEKFVRGFVKMTKDLTNILMWDLGNECNCMGAANSPAASSLWTFTIRNAILASDNTRKICSGMHGLEYSPYAAWSIKEQGTYTDMLTPHPYPSPTIGGDVDPANRLRTSILPTAQCEYYKGIGGRDVMIQEQGTFSDMLIDRAGAADFMRVNVCSSIANNFKGYFWWCSHEHLHLTKPPYSWSMVERELGILDADHNPKPVAVEMKRLGGILDILPELPEKEYDSVIMLSNDQRQWQVAATSFILAKEAGLTPAIRSSLQVDNIPHYGVYILPSITGWAALFKEPYELLLDRVYSEGANLLITVASGFICEFERVSGLRSHGMAVGGRDTMQLDGESLPIEYFKKFELEALDAEVLATDSTGNPVFTCHKFGKGNIYMLTCQLENMVWNRAGAYNEGSPKWYKIYAKVAGDVIAAKPMRCDAPDVSLTLHPCEDGYYATAVNYTNRAKSGEPIVADGWELSPIYGDFTNVEADGLAVGKLTRK